MVHRIDVTLEDLRQLQERIARKQLEGEDWAVFGGLVSRLITRTMERQARLKAKAARQAARQSAEEEPAKDAGDNGEVEHSSDADCPRSEEPSESSPRDELALGNEAAPGGEPGAESGERDGAESGERDGAESGERDGADSGQKAAAKKGHGRNGAKAFVGAPRIRHFLGEGVIGAICCRCKKTRIGRYGDQVIIRVIGQPTFEAECHHFEQGRCRRCGAVVTAEGSEALVEAGIGTRYVTYDWSACGVLIVLHYFAGMPFQRLEALHRGWGIPMPDANQWRVVDECDDLLAPLYRALERHAVRHARTLRFDDTGSMILDTKRQIRKELEALERLGESTKNVRTGINASAIYIETEQGKAVLFFTGRHHAAEIVDRLLEHRRASTEKLATVSDAASKNFSHGHADQLEQAVCNAHCYLKFRALKEQFPTEYAMAGEVYAKVFDNDDRAQALGLGPHERMLYHRERSKPQMLRLWQMCKEKVDQHLVEPNSPLWEPISFVVNQWSRLTKFYEVPGVPLDTNVVEQCLIIPVRYLAGSFAYKTQNGADVGDRHMSLIATANACGIEPVAYLVECLQNHKDLAERPEHYLPWVYRGRLEQHDRSRPPAPSSPPVQHPLRPGTRRGFAVTRASSSAPAQPP